MKTHEFLICPVHQVSPFDINQRWIEEINGVKMNTYIGWLKSCYFITATGLPATSVPCGFTPEGLSVGILIVGRHNYNFGELRLAYAFEKATERWQHHPGARE
jgi:amidase